MQNTWSSINLLISFVVERLRRFEIGLPLLFTAFILLTSDLGEPTDMAVVVDLEEVDVSEENEGRHRSQFKRVRNAEGEQGIHGGQKTYEGSRY